MTLDTGLVGHWRLQGDCRDVSGNGNDGVGRDVDLSAAGPDGRPGGAAGFDGRAGVIEVPDSPSLRLGTADFTIAVWVYTDKELDDVLGDIVSKYDPVRRRGLNLTIQSAVGVTNSQSNLRHLLFGIDDGRSDSRWTDRGRPGNCIYAKALCVYDGALYAGTFETGEGEAGHVYRCASGTEWIDCGSPDRCNAVSALAVYDGRLYAGVSHYRAAGSALAESPNLRPGGRVYRYEGGTRWVNCGKLGGPGTTASTASYSDYLKRFAGWRPDEVDALGGLAVYNGRLYAIPMYHQGAFRYEGGVTWTDCGGPGVRMMALTVFNGHLYGAGNEGNKRGGVYRYEGGTTWARTGDQPGVDQIYSFAVYEGKLHIGTWPEATVFRYDGGETWTSCGRLGEEKEVMGMAVYNGKLYAGTLPLAQVYRYDGDGVWMLTGRLDFTPDVTYRRAWSMAVFQGKLFCGTLPSGRVFSLEAGKVVTGDHELAPGWRHLAAVREAGRLRSYVDGRQVAASADSGADHDLSNDRPLRIGFGQHDHFRGRIADLRLYNRALAETEVAELYSRRREGGEDSRSLRSCARSPLGRR